MGINTVTQDKVERLQNLPPAQVASALADRVPIDFCLALEIRPATFNVGHAIAWIDEFQIAMDKISADRPGVILPPPIVVIGAKFTEKETDELRTHGAVIIDQSISSNAQCVCMETLIEQLSRDLSRDNVELIPAVITPVKMTTPPNVAILNAIPPGVTEQDVIEYIAGLNS